MSYAELLKDPRWQRKRLEVLNRADFTCQECKDKTKTLHVHHTKYVRGRMPWEYDEAELKCLCEDCHSRVTELGVELQHIVGRMPLFLVENIVGFARAWEALYSGRYSVGIESSSVVEGVASALHIETSEVYALAGASKRVDVTDLLVASHKDSL